MLIALALENFIMTGLNIITKTKTHPLPHLQSCDFPKLLSLSARLMENSLQLKVFGSAAVQAAYLEKILASPICQAFVTSTVDVVFPPFHGLYTECASSFYTVNWILVWAEILALLKLMPLTENFGPVSVSSQVSITLITACHFLVTAAVCNWYMLA